MSSPAASANRLIGEQSPYLLQHAYNPVDWFPWGDEAFEKARAADKPIFLSIGYSTCHWCHVMERESFEHAAVAEVLNREFISIKVDREERPDVDRVYMSFVQATTGHGGWPLSVWLTPDRQPFAGGTYFPPEDRYGRPGFLSVLRRIALAWKEDAKKIREHAQSVTNALEEMASGGSYEAELRPEWLDAAYDQFREMYDHDLGGFGGAPKFPRPAVFHFLLRHAEVSPKVAVDARQMVFHSLRCMADGGMYDHVGGGFHRYSVDAFWHVPHFEKMLYDQAQLVSVLLEAYQAGGDPFFKDKALETLGYVMRDLSAPEGGFYSAEDADSLPDEAAPEKREGAFYVWTLVDAARWLTVDELEIWQKRFGIRPEGNVRPESDPHGELDGVNVPAVTTALHDIASASGITIDSVVERLESARQKLFLAREQRPRPHRDDKVITAWNGLMISALAKAYAVTGDKNFLDRALKALDFIARELYASDTKVLFRSYRTQRGTVAGFADDYAFLISALLSLYEVTGEPVQLAWAMELQETLDKGFWDEKQGGYFSVENGQECPLVRMKEDHDGAEPSANSVSFENLIRLGDLLQVETFRARAHEGLLAFGGELRQAPHGVPRMMAALMWWLRPPEHLLLSGDHAGEQAEALQQVAHTVYGPFRVTGYTHEKNWPFNRDRIPAPQSVAGEKPAALLCRNMRCLEAVLEADALRRLLEDRTEA